MSLSAYHRARLLLLAGLVVSVAVFRFASSEFRVPAHPGFGGSLLAEASPVVSLAVVAAALLASVLLSTLLAGSIRFDAGFFCATLGMAAVSCRGGTMGDVLRQAAPTGSASIFIRLAVELVVLYAIIAAAWSLLWGLRKNGNLKGDEFRDGVEDTDEPVWLKVCAMGMQAGVMALLVLLLAQTDSKVQVLAAVGIASYVGALASHYMYPISPSPWLWAGPLAVGVAGYVLAYFGLTPGDELWMTGQLTLKLAPLARPLPLDYATAGPAGAILGYWMSRRWHRQRLADESAAATAPASS